MRFNLILLIIYFLGFFCIKGNEKPLVIVIPSYNNSNFYKQNLNSVFNQNYTNYRVIYIDDCSPDGTASLVAEHIRNTGQQRRFRLIKNKARSYQLANRYKAVHSCDDNEIIVMLDGDDTFAHSEVLNIINQVYKNNDIWMTYTKGLNWQEIPNEIKEKNKFREFCNPHVANFAHLRTFYAWLFKQVRLKDLILDGPEDIVKRVIKEQTIFFPFATDHAEMLPMIEMSSNGKVFQIKENLYKTNINNPINHWKLPKFPWHTYERGNTSYPMDYWKVVYNKNSYKKLEKPIINKRSDINKTDIVVLQNVNQKNNSLIQSINKNILHVNKIFFIHKIEQINSLFDRLSTYVLVLNDKVKLANHLNLDFCIKAMKKTFCYGFYIDIHSNYEILKNELNAFKPFCNKVIAFQYRYLLGSLSKYGDSSMAIFNKSQILKVIQKHEPKNIQELIEILRKKKPSNLKAIGLILEIV